MSKDKGLADDGISDHWIKTTEKWYLLNNIWNDDIMENFSEIFKARLVPLNKKWPDIPNSDEFRPIAILSHFFKFLELRFADKLHDYLINKMDPK